MLGDTPAEISHPNIYVGADWGNLKTKIPIPFTFQMTEAELKDPRYAKYPRQFIQPAPPVSRPLPARRCPPPQTAQLTVGGVPKAKVRRAHETICDDAEYRNKAGLLADYLHRDETLPIASSSRLTPIQADNPGPRGTKRKEHDFESVTPRPKKRPATRRYTIRSSPSYIPDSQGEEEDSEGEVETILTPTPMPRADRGRKM